MESGIKPIHQLWKREPMPQMSDQDIKTILSTTRRIAMAGASTNPARASHHVMAFLLDFGFDVVPVNPMSAGQTLFGRKIVATLAEAAPFDMLDLFRRSEDVLRPVREAIQLGAKTIWMQLGVVNEQAAWEAKAAGLSVIMNRCPAIDIPRLNMKPHTKGQPQ